MIYPNRYQILQDLCISNPPSRAVLFIRHAERHSIEKVGEGREVSLTKNGIETARELGRMLPHQYRLLLSNTGVRRTIQTAEAIVEGFVSSGGRVVIPPISVQSPCGSYLVGTNDLFTMANALGGKFVSHWIKGKISPSLIEPPELAAWHLLRRVMDTANSNCKLPEKNELHIHVAHDWDIYALRYAIFGIEPEQHPVDYLDGIVFVLQDGGIEARSLGKCHQVPARLIPWRKLPSCSVVIPSCGREEGIYRLFTALKQQTHLPDEVFVVGDSAPKTLREKIALFSKDSDFPTSYLETPRQSGPATARNLGIQAAQSEITLFTDDDCEPHLFWCQHHLERLAVSSDEIAGCGGKVLPKSQDPYSRYFTFHHILEAPDNMAYLITANAAYKRDWLMEVGGFDEQIRTTGGEDAELSFRIGLLQGKFVFEPRAIVTHDYRYGISPFARTFFSYGAGGRYCADLLFPEH